MTSHLSPRRHQQRDFFVADLVDVSPKDDIGSMEHPFFALKAGDRRIRHYQRGSTAVEVHPGSMGHATIHDKDIWIYCTSQLVEAMNRKRGDVSRVVRFTAYDFLVATNRPTAGVGYRRMAEALKRLKGTVVYTNIETGGKLEATGFNIIDAFRVIKSDGDDRMVAVEVELPSWLYRAIESKQILTLNTQYFQLRKPIDRRIYEIARKHCGRQAHWSIGLSALKEKSGSGSNLRMFRQSIRSLANSDELPDYTVELVGKDIVHFYSRKPKGQMKKMRNTLAIA